MKINVSKLLGVGYLLLGAGFLVQAVRLLFFSSSSSASGRALPLDAEADQLPGGDQAPLAQITPDGWNAEEHHVRTVEERVAHIREMVRAGGLNPDLHVRAVQALSRKCEDGRGGVHWCTPVKDWKAEKIVIFNAIRDAGNPLGYRYVRDMLRADTFKGAHLAEQVPGGDCDDSVIVLGAVLESVGHPVRLRVVQTIDGDDYDHIYLLSGLPADFPTEWMALDPTVEGQPAGWQVPGADQTARDGKPHDKVVRVRDFEV